MQLNFFKLNKFQKLGGKLLFERHNINFSQFSKKAKLKYFTSKDINQFNIF